MQKIWTLISIVFILFLGWVILRADQGSMPVLIGKIYAFPSGDKVGHFVLMGCLAFCVNLALGGRQIPLFKRRIYLGSALVTLAVALEEFSQMFFRGRHSSLADLAASIAGILLVGTLLAWLVLRRKIPPTPDLKGF
jgi:polysaccharide biosynthesis protein VpsQ